MIYVLLYSLYGVVAGGLGIAAWRLKQARHRFRQHELLTSAQMIDSLPSVTVCIPARNESHAMTESLQRVLATTYPKLEIIVMDDLSGDKTPALIKAFAHEGVRFIEGKKLPEGWLGKNHALNQLLKEASGTYVLFLDVDTHLSPDTIEQLVAYAEQEKATMVSVLPRREDGLRASTVFAPLRYFWELVFHRTEAPAVASSAWLIHRRQFITDFSDFNKLKNVIQPEAHIAATYMAKDAYRFLMSTPMLGLSHEKKWRSQVDTSVRLLYPLVGMKILNVVAVTLDLLILSAPLFVAIGLLLAGVWIHAIAGLIVYVLGVVVYGAYVRSIWRRGWLVAALLWPIITIQEAVLVVRSAILYRRGQVTWKGRPISLPPRTN